MSMLLCLLAGFLATPGCDDSSSTRDAAAERVGRTAGEPPRAVVQGSTAARSNRLNVVLITLDTVRADALGAYGQTLATSPNIDRMATEGVLFSNAMTASPSTLPSHATILTGLFPIAHGVRSNTGYVLGDEQITLAEILSARGYTTAAEIAAPVIDKSTRLDQGFQHYRDPGDFDIKRKKVLVADASAEKGHRLIEAHDREGSDITRFALQFLAEAASADRPFFLWLHYFDPHVPYQAPLSFRKGFEQNDYYAEVRYTDHQVGQIMDALVRHGLRDRTLVVLTSDHGEGLGDHAESTHSFFLYDSTMRVPLLLWGPESVPRGRRIAPLVRTADITPTVLDWLGLPVPESLQGLSLRPLVERRAGADDVPPGYGESIEPLALFGSSMLRTLRVGNWKYIHKLEPELYRVDQDPGELENLATRHPEQIAQIRKALATFVSEGERGAESRGDVDHAQRQQLMALGYLGLETPTHFSDTRDLEELRGPDPARSHDDLSTFVRAHGKLFDGDAEAAARDFRALRLRHPESQAMRDGLLEALHASQQWSEVVSLAQKILAEDPSHAMANETLAKALSASGRTREAEAQLRRAAALLPCGSGTWTQLGILLAEQKRYADQIAAFRQALEQCPDSVSARNDLSFALSTAPEARLRDGAESLRLAEEAVASPGGDRPDFLDTLACAQAEAGQFEAAVATMDRAIGMLELREFPEEALRDFEEHRLSFKAGRPVRAK